MRKTLKDSGPAPVSWTPRFCHVLRAPSRAAATLHTVHDALYEAGWPCQVVVCLSKCLGCACSRPRGRGRWSREVPSALYSRSSRARGARRRMRGFEGWGRHLPLAPPAGPRAGAGHLAGPRPLHPHPHRDGRRGGDRLRCGFHGPRLRLPVGGQVLHCSNARLQDLTPVRARRGESGPSGPFARA